MITDKFGLICATEHDLCEALYRNPTLDLSRFYLDDPVLFNKTVMSLFADAPLLKQYAAPNCETVQEFDAAQQSFWFMPEQYKTMDIAKEVLVLCKDDAELQRAGEELLLYQERNLFDLLRYLRYLVDTMRDNGIVWGVGRGSSVSSFVLYLLGVHKINSLYYDLDPSEFLK